jgi:hypothetical protein
MALRSSIALISGLLVFASTLIWGWLALVVASYGNDSVKLQICGGSLPYTFLNIVAGLGFFAGVSLVWSSLSYASSGKRGKWFITAILATPVLFAIWALAGGFTAADCAFGV